MLSFAIVMLAVVPSSADYTLQPHFGANKDSSLTIDKKADEAGRTFTLDFGLSSDGTDKSITATFEVIFSAGGLILTDYTWANPYVTAGSDDYSTPAIGNLPADLSVATYGDAAAVDIELSNALDVGEFGAGTLVSIDILVPSDFPEGDVMISVGGSPEFFNANAFGLVSTGPGSDFTLTVVPEPATLVLLAFGGLSLIGRRKA